MWIITTYFHTTICPQNCKVCLSWKLSFTIYRLTWRDHDHWRGDIWRLLIIFSITLPKSSLVEIEDGAFKKCRSLISIHIPPSVTKIGNNVFEYCEALQLIVIPKYISIAPNSFEECKSFDNKKGTSYKTKNYEWLKTRFDDVPIHRACYDLRNTNTKYQYESQYYSQKRQ